MGLIRLLCWSPRALRGPRIQGSPNSWVRNTWRAGPTRLPIQWAWGRGGRAFIGTPHGAHPLVPEPLIRYKLPLWARGHQWVTRPRSRGAGPGGPHPAPPRPCPGPPSPLRPRWAPEGGQAACRYLYCEVGDLAASNIFFRPSIPDMASTFFLQSPTSTGRSCGQAGRPRSASPALATPRLPSPR